MNVATRSGIAPPASAAQGDVLYYNGSAWVRLAAGTSGQYLQTQGAGANPQWATGSAATTFSDSVFRVQDNADATKEVAFEVSGVTTSTTRTLTVPNFDGTIATLAGTETLTNKTLGATTLSGDIDADGNNIDDSGVLFQREQASADADVAGQGQWWTKTATPNRPMFTDDTGQDFELLGYDFAIAASDESTALTASTSTAIATFHAQRDCVLEEVLIGVTTAPTGSTLTADVHLNGTTIFSTKPTIDATEKTSVTAATAAVLSTTAVSKGDLIELFADSVGATVAGAGLKFYFNAYRS